MPLQFYDEVAGYEFEAHEVVIVEIFYLAMFVLILVGESIFAQDCECPAMGKKHKGILLFQLIFLNYFTCRIIFDLVAAIISGLKATSS